MIEEEEEEEYANEPPTCPKCHREYELRYGQVPTEFCDECAHQVVDDLTQQLQTALNRVTELEASLEARNDNPNLKLVGWRL